MPHEFNIDNYKYHLPSKRIAQYPLPERSKSKLLVWNKGNISHHSFEQAPALVPRESMLVFNDTKVIAARILFRKSTGAEIEIFLLHPELPTRDIAESMHQKGSAVWTCMIGNKKKWKAGELIYTNGNCTLKATYYNRENNLVGFEWNDETPFAEIINIIGQTPLPPYLKRKAEKEDSSRYQTVYSRNDGAVAAPTAGLHFTESVLDKMRSRAIKLEYLTLHVSAGTFKPIEKHDYRDHEMHNEQLAIKKESIRNLLPYTDRLIAVGTTSLRILETLYWYGVLLVKYEDAPLMITKDTPYKYSQFINQSFKESLNQIINYMDRNNLSVLHGETEIFIYPGYEIKTTRGLFTNFHLPKSTLLLLVSTFTGHDWEKVYKEALTNDYRFLSYGDSSLLLR